MSQLDQTAAKEPTPIFCAYIHRKPDGTPFYVGKASSKHRPQDMGNRSKWHKNITAILGAENVVVSLIKCASEELAYKIERELIACFRRMGFELANVSDGGGGGALGVKRGAETRAKIAAAKTGTKLSEETKAKISADRIGKKFRILRPRKGRRLSEETKAKISSANKGKKHTEQIARLAAARRALTRCKHGHEFTPENVHIKQNGARACIECGRIRAREFNRKKFGIPRERCRV